MMMTPVDQLTDLSMHRKVDAEGGRMEAASLCALAGDFKFIGFRSCNLAAQAKWEREIIKRKEMDGRDGNISNEISRQPLRQIERKRRSDEEWEGERERLWLTIL
jgi:hypothetical protein